MGATTARQDKRARRLPLAARGACFGELRLREIGPVQLAKIASARAKVRARVHDLVEKPTPAQAPSDLGVMGRYVLTPTIFDALARTKPCSGGEIQLTDAIKLLLESEPVFGYTFAEGRFDAGNKLDYLRATVDLALDRPDLGPPFLAYLQERFRQP